MALNPFRASYSRRHFIKSAVSTGVVLSMPDSMASLLSKTTRICLITDLHQDIMHDGEKRLQSFLEYTKRLQPHAVLQMGDFATPKPSNKAIIDRFNRSHSKPLHVLGNHDTDGGFTPSDCMSFWGMEAPYYAKRINGVWFIILDGNDKGAPAFKGGYPSYIGPQQVEWLKATLAAIKEPAVIVSHQPLAGPMAIDNAEELQKILSSWKNKILLAINGHTHIDAKVEVNGINYIHINSASYFWAGKNYMHTSYSADIHEKFPWIAYTFPYRDALFALLTIDPLQRSIRIDGATSSWQGASPTDLNYNEATIDAKYISPKISNYKL